jgi:hypothetical protein
MGNLNPRVSIQIFNPPPCTLPLNHILHDLFQGWPDRCNSQRRSASSPPQAGREERSEGAEYLSQLATMVIGNLAPMLCERQPRVPPFPACFRESASGLVMDSLGEQGLSLTPKARTGEFSAFLDGHI